MVFTQLSNVPTLVQHIITDFCALKMIAAHSMLIISFQLVLMEFNTEISQLVTPNLWSSCTLSVIGTNRKSWGPSPNWPRCGTFMFVPLASPADVFMADHRSGGKWWGVITALATVTGLKKAARGDERHSGGSGEIERNTKKKESARLWEVASPVQERPQTLGWSLQSGWESWAETCRKPGQRLASSLSLSSVQLLTNEKTVLKKRGKDKPKIWIFTRCPLSFERFLSASAVE